MFINVSQFHRETNEHKNARQTCTRTRDKQVQRLTITGGFLQWETFRIFHQYKSPNPETFQDDACYSDRIPNNTKPRQHVFTLYICEKETVRRKVLYPICMLWIKIRHLSSLALAIFFRNVKQDFRK